MEIGRREGDHQNFKHPPSRFIVTIVHPQKDVPGGASGGYSEEDQTEDQVMRFLIMLEQTETGFAVEAPDLAIATYGETIEAAKRAASEAIQINLEAITRPDNRYLKGRASQAILRIPNFGICCSRTSR